jgi:hypothetical protein
MSLTHPTAQALLENGPKLLAGSLAQDVTFRTPILTRDLEGDQLVWRYLREAGSVLDQISYYDAVGDDDRAVLFWRSQVWERDIEGATVITTNDDGLITGVTELMRSYTIISLFRDAMLIALADVIPLESWLLRDEGAPQPDPDSGVGRPPAVTLAPDARFHSPMLTKTIAGADNVHAVHKLIGSIQGPRAFHARFERDRRRVEQWSCVIEGSTQDGIDVFDFDDSGQVTDQYVWLRPWPVTTLLRDRAMAGQVPALPADVWLLPAHPIPLA